MKNAFKEIISSLVSILCVLSIILFWYGLLGLLSYILGIFWDPLQKLSILPLTLFIDASNINIFYFPVIMVIAVVSYWSFLYITTFFIDENVPTPLTQVELSDGQMICPNCGFSSDSREIEICPGCGTIFKRK